MHRCIQRKDRQHSGWGTDGHELSLGIRRYRGEVKQSEQFNSLIENAFSPNFGDAFLKSVTLANVAGVKQDEILSSRDDIDCFFLD